MTIKEYRASAMVAMLSAKKGSGLEKAYKEEVEAIDRVIIGSKQAKEALHPKLYGYAYVERH